MPRISLMASLALSSALCTPAMAGDLTRIATVPYKAEVTGILVNAAGELFFNAQHPDGAGETGDGSPAAVIGYVAGTDFNAYSGGSIAVPGEDARGQVHAAGDYVILGTSGQSLGDGTVLGGVYDAAGALMFMSNDVDYNAFVPISDDEAYLFTAFEGASRKAVSTISRLKLVRQDGRWTTDPAQSKSLDLSSIEGAWVLCYGVSTAWGSEMLAEEYYFYNTALWNHPDNHDDDERAGFEGGNDVTYHMPKLMDRHLGKISNPYRYGYMIEMHDPAAEDPTLVRHYAMGRFSHENGAIMPDGRTVYMSDDDSPKYTDAKYNSNSGGVFFKFVADRAEDMSSGTLYAAKATQDAGSDAHSTGFAIEWIPLAHGDDATVAGWIDAYEGIGPDAYVEGQSSYISDQDVWNWAEGKAGADLNGDGVQGSYPDDRPAFLESRKAAAALGATYEWNKMEGVTTDGSQVFLVMSEVAISMDAGWGHAPWDTGARDEADGGVIALQPEPCGGVYRGTLDADYNLIRLDPAIMGQATEAGCDPDGIANPDNVLAFKGGLLIAEDAGPKMHPVDMLWLWKE
ncbi:MAG: DUF839 domain-containing protein [Rhodobacteraceae bacterium]|nr:DUF839 domain-containing protein [Paracoccaceae bacterium]